MADSGDRPRAALALALVALVLAGVALACLPAASSATMRATKISRHLCKTVGGGRFVPIPEFPGERIDRRLLPDIHWMERRFHIFITDGYSPDPVHARGGEHPIGLATDIVPNWAEGGTWGEIGVLAHLAEPRQNDPRPPWRWVGWNGDPGHGRGDHLHLSWLHSPAQPGHPARVVYTRRCPGARKRAHSRSGGPTGGTNPSGGGASGGGGTTGGVAPKVAARLGPSVAAR
jgi:uncharacterized membrane protein YgcG